MLGRTGSRGDKKRHILLRATKEKALWRASIAHVMNLGDKYMKRNLTTF